MSIVMYRFEYSEVMRRVISLLILFLSISYSSSTPIVGGEPADAPNMMPTDSSSKPPPKPLPIVPPPETPTVEPPLAAIVSGITNLTIVGLQLPTMLAFLGIRYAEPPTGKRRFQVCYTRLNPLR